jgi:hypothetical protein
MQYINVPAGNYNLVLGEDILSMNTAKIYLQCQTSLGAINILLPRITNPNGTSLKNWWFTVYINDADGNASVNNIKMVTIYLAVPLKFYFLFLFFKIDELLGVFSSRFNGFARSASPPSYLLIS